MCCLASELRMASTGLECCKIKQCKICVRDHICTPEPKIFTIWPFIVKKKKKNSVIFDPDRKNLRGENKQSSSRFISLIHSFLIFQSTSDVQRTRLSTVGSTDEYLSTVRC